jgi:iron complex transport system ATP-binding protein
MDGQPLSERPDAPAQGCELSLDDVCVALGGRTVVNDVSTSFVAGELVALLGPNGVGKTTLLRAAAGLIGYQGHILLDGVNLMQLSPRQRATRIGYLAQTPTVHWPMRVCDIVALGRLPHLASVARLSEADRAAIDRAILAAELQPLAERRVTELSAGELARVLLARALAGEAQVLLADEPNAALDPYHQLHVMELLHEEARRGVAVIAVLHDLRLAAQFADRVLLMDNGQIIAEGAPADVLTAARLADVYGIHRGPDGSTAELLGPAWRRAQPIAR